MGLPDELTLERFRAFGGRASLPLRPITLVYGPNNAGKSALLRALALLGHWLEVEAGGGLRLPKLAFPSQSFQSLSWQGEAGAYHFRIGLRWREGAPQEFTWTLNGGGGVDPYVRGVELSLGPGQQSWMARENEDRRLVDPSSGTALPFEGLRPGPGQGTPLEEVRTRLAELRGRIRWLSGVRVPVPPVLKAEGQDELSVTSDGEGAAAVLIRDPALFEQVCTFYERLDSPRRLSLHEVPPVGYFLSLNPEGRPGWRVPIQDTGEGMAQVLPVLTLAALAARGGGVLAVEEPESHLHPSAQRVLADYLCRLANSPASPRFILETHSRVFLLAVQLAVARGFPAEKVAIVWVDQSESGRSSTTHVSLRPNGRMGDGWPSSALGEDLLLARELARMGSPLREAE